MRIAVPFALLAAAALLAGCSAQGSQDPFAYTRKPLYAGGFDLARMAGEETQEFRVQDGSIGMLRVLVWVNATAGGAQVDITDPSGRTIVSTTDTTEATTGLNLGAWHVRVSPQAESAGTVHVLVVRA